MQYIPNTMSLEDRARIELLESEIAEQKEKNDTLTQCILEMSEVVYQ